MRKPYKYNELSEKKCRACGARLKKNLLDKKPEADLCYSRMRNLGFSVSFSRKFCTFLEKETKDIENLKASCHKCNRKINKDYTSKFKRLYGMKAEDIAISLGIKIYKVRKLHLDGKLYRILKPISTDIENILF